MKEYNETLYKFIKWKEESDKIVNKKTMSEIIQNLKKMGVEKIMICNGQIIPTKINRKIFIRYISRKDKIDILKEGEKFEFARYGKIYGNFFNVSDEILNGLVEELDILYGRRDMIGRGN